MQMVVQYDLIVHQMDVQTTYLHAPIDYEIFVEEPEGFKTNKLVYRLNKSLYGLKQSGRNWNKMLHECLIEKIQQTTVFIWNKMRDYQSYPGLTI